MLYRTNLFCEILGVLSYDFIENNYNVFVLEFFSCIVIVYIFQFPLEPKRSSVFNLRI